MGSSMNNNKSTNIQIRKEVTDFLELQIYGQRSNQCLARFTKVSLSDDAKAILKVIENAIYFGYQCHPLQSLDMVAIQRIISTLTVNVSLLELNLVHYISLIVEGNQDQSKFDIFEKTYNRILSKRRQPFQHESSNVLAINENIDVITQREKESING